MQRNRLGCLTGTGIFAALITALFIVGYACHADKDEHNGANGKDCGACHTPTDWGQVK